MADINATLKQQTFDLAQGERITDVHYHRQADYLGRTVEITEGIAHHRKLRAAKHRFMRIRSDTTSISCLFAIMPSFTNF
jgi:hypothetical protein